MEKRLNILFDHLNNEDLLSDSTMQEMVGISYAVQAKDWDQAMSLWNAMQTAKLATEGTNWMVGRLTNLMVFCDANSLLQVGVKRLINFGKVSKA